MKTCLVDDLLAFSRLGRERLQKTDTDLNQLVQDAMKDFAGPTKERNIAWAIQPLPVVQADRSLLRMVLVNLVSNAVKFTGGRAEAKIEIGQAPDENHETVIYIRDNGAGFDPKYTDKLFGVFQRLHSNDEFEGTGIGLANVQRIIHRHGGRTWAKGCPRRGRDLLFFNPQTGGAIDMKLILIAEDDPRDEQLTVNALEEYHLANQLFIVRNGEETLDYLYRRGKYSLRAPGNPVAVLLDLKMPKITGLEVLRIVKADENLKTIHHHPHLLPRRAGPDRMLQAWRQCLRRKACGFRGVYESGEAGRNLLDGHQRTAAAHGKGGNITISGETLSPGNQGTNEITTTHPASGRRPARRRAGEKRTGIRRHRV